MLMPSHAKHVKLYKDTQPLFTRYGIESQLDAMFSPIVQLRSGGYIVINQAEALVAIDVNSGRATREHHIEDTALKTNGEAAEEIARQLRLRDLAGLIVIDFIDMDEGRNNRTVERRMKDALKHDRARIQVGRISHFGLLEMSRQRIRTSVLESSTEKCPVCGGSGHVRSVSSVALQLLRAIEETLIKGATHNLIVRTRSEVALYVLNHKRAHLRDLEERFRITITISADPTVNAQVSYIVDRGEQVHTVEAAKTAGGGGAAAIALDGRGRRRRARRRGRGRGRGRSRRRERERHRRSGRGAGSRASRQRRRSAARRWRARRRPPAAPAWPRSRPWRRAARTARGRPAIHPRDRARALRSRTRITMPARPRKPVSTSSSRAKAALRRGRRRGPPAAPARPPRRTPQPARPQWRGAVPSRQWRRTGARNAARGRGFPARERRGRFRHRAAVR